MSVSGYVFIGNSTKPTEEKLNSREPITPGNVSRPCIETALALGYEVYLGTNRNRPEELSCDLPVKLFDSHTYRSITAFRDNRIAYKNLMNVIDEGKVDFIHCNTPVGGMIGRLCGKRKKVKHIVYTAHGFHFYKGAPFFNRTVLKWAEKRMARWTDAIITMNQEDYEAAEKFRLRKGGKVYYVPGVGINTEEYFSVTVDRAELRQSLGLSENDVVLISAGRLDANKNNETAIRAVAKVPNVKLLLCGDGELKAELKALSESLGVSDRILFLGNRTDILELYQVADIFIMMSFREGLSRSIMEAMASGLPCVASKIRGNVDLLEDGVGGYLCDPKDVRAFAHYIDKLAGDEALRARQAAANLERIKGFDVKVVKSKIEEIYREVLDGNSR